MRAILIDSINRKVLEVDTDFSLESIYKLLDCSTITVVYLENGDCVYVDDEALLKNPRNFFELGDYDQAFAGNGLVVGTDDEGETIEPKSTVKEIDNDVIFMDIATVLLKYA